MLSICNIVSFLHRLKSSIKKKFQLNVEHTSTYDIVLLFIYLLMFVMYWFIIYSLFQLVRII